MVQGGEKIPWGAASPPAPYFPRLSPCQNFEGMTPLPLPVKSTIGHSRNYPSSRFIFLYFEFTIKRDRSFVPKM